MDEYKKEKLKKLFSSKQFVLALTMLVVVTIVGGYYAYTIRQINKINPPPIATGETSFFSQGTSRQEQNKDRGESRNNQIIPSLPSQPILPYEPLPVSPNETTGEETSPPKEAEVNQNIEERPAPSVFSLPLGTDIGKDFSRNEMVFNSTLGDWRVHNGIDFLGVIGDTVKAVAAGKVIDVYDDPLWGRVVEIDHGGGILAKYCGLGKGSTLDIGTEVKMNDSIGNLGLVPAEKDEPDHLHFEVYVNRVLTDPLEVLGRF